MYTNKSRLNRSKRLRKIATVYNSIIRKEQISKSRKSPRRKRTAPKTSNKKRNGLKLTGGSSKKTKSKNKTKRPLTEYQKFVKKESKKDKYRDIPGKQRLTAIASEWNKRKKRIKINNMTYI